VPVDYNVITTFLRNKIINKTVSIAFAVDEKFPESGQASFIVEFEI